MKPWTLKLDAKNYDCNSVKASGVPGPYCENGLKGKNTRETCIRCIIGQQLDFFIRLRKKLEKHPDRVVNINFTRRI